MLNPIIKFFSSLRLTVVCLVCAMVLVFVGTLAQVHLGLWDAQKHYFHSLFVFWTPQGTTWKIPVWPGGYLLGWVLLINLLAAHITRFQFSRKKVGIFLTHIGLILLLVGQFLTELFQVESNLRLEEGESKNYSESTRHTELALVDVSDPSFDEVIAVPDTALAQKREIRHPKLPFTLRVKEWYPNSDYGLVAPVMEPTAPRGTHGVGTRLTFTNVAVTAKMDQANWPAAQVEVVTEKGVESTWMVSSWLAFPPAVNSIQRELGGMLGDVLEKPQEFAHAGHTYRIALRPTRYYKPHHISLVDFRHDLYTGTDKPKNFSSDVRVQNQATGEDREVRISMNKPLRHGGETYYQGSFDPNNSRVTILHVVRNPAWLTPYISCTLVGIGLITQFLTHLIGFVRKRSGQNRPTQPPPKGVKMAPGKAKPARAARDTEALAAGVRRTAERRSS